MADKKRLTAIKTRLKPVVEGMYHAAEGFSPAYIITPEGQKVSRARVMGTVMTKFASDDGNYGFLVIDDETETIRAKFFKDLGPMENVEVGDLVDVVGKLRQYEGEMYIQPEVVRRVEDPNFLVLRLTELAQQQEHLEETRQAVAEIDEKAANEDELRELAEAAGIDPELAQAMAQSSGDPKADKKELKETLLSAIEELDDEKGAEYSAVVEKAGVSEAKAEPVINELLSEGTCFEPRPGKIKKL